MIFQLGDKVRIVVGKTESDFIKSFQGLTGTVIEINPYSRPNLLKIKYDTPWVYEDETADYNNWEEDYVKLITKRVYKIV